ncbi:MAG: proton-conducting transporter membrane subunit [Acidimicrobiia bacterium]|nr:proton-conducting transporter membrane subunit [Acidimicrobiia bacterium]
MPLTLSIAAYFVVAALIGLAGTRLRHALIPLALAPFAAQLIVVATAASNPADFETISWLPSLGVELVIRVNDLTLVLTSVVATIGFLIVAYSARYFTDAPKRAKFLGLMVFFSGGMAGLVAADDLFALFLFWEVTTVASYLLIGFDDQKAAARAAAVQAVLVTSVGGLAMLGGFVLLSISAGTASISAIVAAPPEGTTATVALVLILLGAFTKSAQFPFHFWLPGAMAAPTPASAYLHSATMVKAGIVLLLLLAPGFASEPVWAVTVTTVGLITMTLGAVQAMRQHDLKLLLAHGTVSQLGFMVALIGAGLTGAALAVLVAHAAFKATLFLVVGIIDKKTGTRDIRHLSGIRWSSPVLAGVAATAAISMAGIPPVLGFVSKEAAFDAVIADGEWILLAVAGVASALTVAYTARFWWGAFEEQPGGVDVAHLGQIDRPLIAPPALLAVASIVFGILPGGLESAVIAATADKVKLVLWPGFKPALAVSAAAIAGGALIHLISHRTWTARTWWSRLIEPTRLPPAQNVYSGSVRLLNRTADAVTGIVQNGSLPVYLAVILTTIFSVTAVTWLVAGDATPDWRFTNGAPEVILAVIAIATAIATTRAKRRMAAALLLGAVGFAVAGIYIAFGAPDLALTQLLIETFTVALFAFVLSRLPRRFGAEPASLSRSVRLAVAGLAGAFVTMAALLATSVSPDRDVATFYAENAEPAGGRNIVNVILTDFRALDTLGEITVLAAAAIGIGALVATNRRRNRTEEAS